MRVHVDDPADLPDLIESLRSRPDAVVTQLGHDELEVSLLGSFGDDALRMEVELRVRAWMAAHRAAATVDIAD